MVSEIGVYDLPVRIGIEVEQLVSLIEQERRIREELARQREIVLSLMLTEPALTGVRYIITQRHVVSVERTSPHRRLNWARLEKEFPEGYEFLLKEGVIKVVQPSNEWKLVVREKKKRKGDDPQPAQDEESGQE